jgi:molecular chaperone GrpE
VENEPIMTTPNEQDRIDRPVRDPNCGDEGSGTDVEQIQASLAAAEARAQESKDLYLRALAEIENVRKRASRDVEAAHKYAVERFAGDLIDVKDSLELGLSNTGAGANEALRSGTEATLKLLSRAFEKAGVKELSPLGEPFNPELHEAMAAQPSADQPPNTVMQVVQKGYQLNNRLLRPARVIVSREP